MKTTETYKFLFEIILLWDYNRYVKEFILGGLPMKLIESFKVDHTRLLPGIYVSRKDDVNGNVVTTFDIRVTRPNYEPAMNTAEIHAI